MPPLRGTGSSAGVSVTPEKALQIGAVYSCVRLLSETGSMLPVGVYRAKSGGRVRVDDHPLVPLITDAPNPNLDSAEFFGQLLAWQLLRGNAYAYVQRNRGGVRSEHHNRRPAPTGRRFSFSNPK
ncbi:phage portal protein [Saccharopolyspora rosea]|uniref:Phage portal protein n=1 Tax=Saccharopolyspora rosea TaxID=524884 RepID=A0ABW3FXC7_9PSEU|nr:phage portal protein [Saccharopolyspora rosea]